MTFVLDICTSVQFRIIEDKFDGDGSRSLSQEAKCSFFSSKCESEIGKTVIVQCGLLYLWRLKSRPELKTEDK